MINKFVFMLFFSFSTFNLFATRFEITPLVEKTYDKIISLRFDEAEILLQQMRKDEPQNLLVHHLENYIDFFTVFINEDKDEFKRLIKNKSKRISAIRKGDKSSPYYYYIQAEINLQWALARLKFEEYFTTFNEVNSTYDLLTKNQKKHPSFIPNKKSLGIIHALIGTLPDSYQWGVKLLGGMKGDISKGQKEIEEVIEYAQQNNYIFEEETLVMYAFLMLHLNNKSEKAWEIIYSGKLDPTTNPLACFVLANVAMRTGRNDDAIKILEQRPKSDVYFPFPFLDYMLGLAKLYRLDTDANIYLKRYVDDFKGMNYIKEAYQKLSWHALLQNNFIAYYKNMNDCKTKGFAVIDSDKTALKEARNEERPDPDLLRARLLFDGGYYDRAFDLLEKKRALDFSSNKSKLEFTYRLGRITHKLGQSDLAIKYYNTTIDKGRDESYFFACNAALQIGLIYEQMSLYAKAEEYFKLCLDIKPDEYRNGLHHKAKAGLNRLK